MPLPDRFNIIVGGRQSGKTMRLLEWVAEGERIPRYPGWNRVLVVHSIDESLRLRSIIRADPENPMFEDDAHRVYSFEEWREAVGVSPEVQVALDNAEFALARLIGPGMLTKVSLTGEVEKL